MDELPSLKDRRVDRSMKTSEIVARELASYIIDNGLEEGTVLPPEREMTDAFDVGRTTLREGLRLLETRGVITIRSGPRGGPVVRKPRADDLRGGLSLILQFEKASLSDVLEAREALEPTIAALAAKRISDDELASLEETITNMRLHDDSQEAFLRENRKFHGVIAQAAGSSVLRIFNESLKSIGDGAFAGVDYTTHRRNAVADAHERVFDELADHDPEGAEQAMRRHLDEARQYWEQKYSDLIRRPVRWIR